MSSTFRQVARYIQSVSDAGENPKLQETLEALKPYACLGARTLSGACSLGQSCVPHQVLEKPDVTGIAAATISQRGQHGDT